MVIATVYDFNNEIIHTSEAGSVEEVKQALELLYPEDKFEKGFTEDDSIFFIQPREAGALFSGELTPVTFD